MLNQSPNLTTVVSVLGIHSLLQKVDTYLIHYSHLVARHEMQRRAYTWELLQPSVVTEHSIDDCSLAIPAGQSSYANLRASMLGNINSISYILDYHAYCAFNGIRKIRPALMPTGTSAIISHTLKLHYMSALRAFSRKNQELSFQHIHAIKSFVNSGNMFGLFLEDDAFPLIHNQYLFSGYLEDLLADMLLVNYGFCDVSNSFNWISDVPTSTHYSIRRMADGQTKCSSSYLLTRDAAIQIASSCEYPFLPIDWHLSYLLHTLSIPTYWSLQPLFVQGSQVGIVSSNQDERSSD